MFHMGGGAWDQFDELSEKFERFKGKYFINCLVKIPLRKKFHTRAFRIFFFIVLLFSINHLSKIHRLIFYLFYLNLFLIHEV